MPSAAPGQDDATERGELVVDTKVNDELLAEDDMAVAAMSVDERVDANIDVLLKGVLEAVCCMIIELEVETRSNDDCASVDEPSIGIESPVKPAPGVDESVITGKIV